MVVRETNRNLGVADKIRHDLGCGTADDPHCITSFSVHTWLYTRRRFVDQIPAKFYKYSPRFGISHHPLSPLLSPNLFSSQKNFHRYHVLSHSSASCSSGPSCNRKGSRNWSVVHAFHDINMANAPCHPTTANEAAQSAARRQSATERTASAQKKKFSKRQKEQERAAFVEQENTGTCFHHWGKNLLRFTQ